jgi:hypothetical protein
MYALFNIPTRTQIESRVEELKSTRPISLHFFKEDSIEAFQRTIKDLFLGGESRDMTKRYLKLFIEKIEIKLPKVEIVAKSDVVLAVLENKKAVRTDGVLTAVGSWLPGTDSNRRLSGYKCPDISIRLGLSHHPSQIVGLRVSGASPGIPRSTSRSSSLCTFPEQRHFRAWLRITILHVQ